MYSRKETGHAFEMNGYHIILIWKRLWHGVLVISV